MSKKRVKLDQIIQSTSHPPCSSHRPPWNSRVSSDILAHIFSFLWIPYDLVGIRSVHSEWNSISRWKQLWSTEETYVDVECERDGDLSTWSFQKLISCSALQFLVVKATKSEPIPPSTMRKLTQLLPNLTSLKLIDVYFLSREMIQEIDRVTNLSRLHFWLIRYPNNSGSGTPLVHVTCQCDTFNNPYSSLGDWYSLMNRPSLTYLEITGYTNVDAYTFPFATISNLKSLCLLDTDVTDEALKKLTSNSAMQQGLTELDVQGCEQLTEEGLSTLNMLKGLKKLGI